jgi:hypothetical protein
MAFFALLLLTATSSGGRRTGPAPQPDSAGLAKQQQQQQSSGSGGASADLRSGQHAHDLSAESLETRKEAAEALAARYRASRERLHEVDDSSINGGGRA